MINKLIILSSLFFSLTVSAAFNGQWYGGVDVESGLGECANAVATLDILESEDVFHIRSFEIKCTNGGNISSDFDALVINNGRLLIDGVIDVGRVTENEFVIDFKENDNNSYYFAGTIIDNELEIKELVVFENNLFLKVSGTLGSNQRF